MAVWWINVCFVIYVFCWCSGRVLVILWKWSLAVWCGILGRIVLLIVVVCVIFFGIFIGVQRFGRYFAFEIGIYWWGILLVGYVIFRCAVYWFSFCVGSFVVGVIV